MKNPVYADCRRREEKTDHFYPSPWTRRKRNITVTIEEFASIVNEENQNIKSIYSLT
jgi:hypothetical protein